MINEIKYNGYSSNPSDYQCSDGDLSLSMNAIVEDGAIHSIPKPKVVMTLQNGKKVIYIHSISTFKNYIIYDESTSSIEWVSSDNTVQTPKHITSIQGKDLLQITSMGNTLVILTSQGIIYVIYKLDNYVSMGTGPVYPNISFRLSPMIHKTDEIHVNNFQSFDLHPTPGAYANMKTLSNEASNAVKEAVMAKVNLASTYCKGLGAFQYPMYIRYGYRMYDGSMSYISPPIKLFPSQYVPTLVEVRKTDSSGNTVSGFHLTVYNIGSYLSFEISNLQEVKAAMNEWSGMITSIDFFVTKPLYTIDEQSACKYEIDYGRSVAYNDKMIRCEVVSCGNLGGEADEFGEKIHRVLNSKDFFGIKKRGLNINETSLTGGDDSTLPFFLLSSINIKDIEYGEQEVPIKEGVLSSLETRETLKGDSNINGTMVPQYAFPYNARLNLAGVTIIPPVYPFESFVQFANGGIYEGNTAAVVQTYSYKAYIFIEADRKKVLVDIKPSMQLNINSLPEVYFFYPNPHTTEIIIERTDKAGVNTYSVSRFKKHSTLNGAYCFINTLFNDSPDMGVIKNVDKGFSNNNKIYTSDVNSPFIFPASGVTMVGNGTVVGISSAAKALSEGQFGQFPLYAFTSEGVWALEVSPTGGYSARQPITRDVCICSESITQIDTSVLFASDRGIMLLSGSQSTCISEIIDRNEPFSLLAFPKGKELIQLSGLPISDINMVPFRDFLRQSRMLYDYTHQHIIVYNRDCLYAYVFSLGAKQWGMMESNIDSGVNSYPESLAMDKAGNLINYSEESVSSVTSLLLTRSIKLGDPSGFKTIDTIIQRGYYADGSVKQVLYGSNDYRYWFPVKSSVNQYLRGFSGTPFKAFRIAIIANLDKYDSLIGCSLSYTPRMTNRLR